VCDFGADGQRANRCMLMLISDSDTGQPSYLGTLCAKLLTSFFFPSFLPFSLQNDTLMQYLLDKLHSYKEDFSDALAPALQEASASFAGKAVLLHPATMEALCMTHAALTMDMAMLCKDVIALHAAMVEDISQKLNDVTNLINTALAPSLGTLGSPQDMNGEHTLFTLH